MTVRNAFGDIALDSSVSTLSDITTSLKEAVEAIRFLSTVRDTNASLRMQIVGGTLPTVTTVGTVTTVSTVTSATVANITTNGGFTAAPTIPTAMNMTTQLCNISNVIVS